MSGLPREVIRWLQSLDLTWQVKNAKWDLSNGYLIAEIFSWYYPQAIQMHNFYPNGTSLKTKQLNWDLLNTFIKRSNIDIPQDFTDATMHCKEGAAMLLVQRMYEILTNRKVKKKDGFEVDFTDRAYQAKLPMHARTTASQAVKNNIRQTELDAQQNVIHTQYKAHDVIRNHVEQRRIDRMDNPGRFNIKPSIAERAARRPPPKSTAYDDSPEMPNSQARARLVRSVPGTGIKKKSALKSKTPSSKETDRKLSFDKELQVVEIPVNQMSTPANNTVALEGS